MRQEPRTVEIKKEKGAFERFWDGRSCKTSELISSDRQCKKEAWKFETSSYKHILPPSSAKSTLLIAAGTWFAWPFLLTFSTFTGDLQTVRGATPGTREGQGVTAVGGEQPRTGAGKLAGRGGFNLAPELLRAERSGNKCQQRASGFIFRSFRLVTELRFDIGFKWSTDLHLEDGESGC